MTAAARWTLVACILASAVVLIDGTVVNVALPALRDDLGASFAGQQWVVEAYLLTLGSLVLVGGSLGDLLGRRRVLSAGLAGFGMMSAACAVAPSLGVLVAARALQGVAGALLVPSSLAIITATFEGPARGVAIGRWTAWTSAAVAAGPPLGGLLVDAASWRLVFAINVPLVLVALRIVARHVPELPGEEGRRIDVLGAALCALGLAALVFGLVAHPIVWGAVGAGTALLAAFLVYEGRFVREPMLPLSLFRSRDFTVANAATLAIYAGLGSATFFLALFLQQIAGYSALAAGFALLPMVLALLTLAGRFGALAARTGPRTLMASGPAVAAVGIALWLRLDARGDYVTQVLPGALVFGLGMAMTVAPLTTTVLGAVEASRAGVASGVNNAVARVAGLLAIAVVGAVVSARFAAVVEERVPDRPPRTAAVEDRPLVRDGRAHVAPRLRAAADAADVPAFHAGMGFSAALVLAGGVVSLVGLRRRPG